MKKIKIQLNEQDYIFRGYNGVWSEAYQKNGDWTDFLPSYEPQKKDFDTMACVSFSACNCLEIIFNSLYKQLSIDDLNWLNDKGYLINGKFNFSDRFVAEMSGTTKKGNYLRIVGDTIRKYGLVPESKWTFPENITWNEYYQNIEEEIKVLGKEFLKRFNIKYEFVYKTDFNEALKKAPIQVIVNAWTKNNGIYYNKKNYWNHAVTLFKENHIFDHYQPYIKQLTPDYNYGGFGVIYSISKTKPKLMELKNKYRYVCVEGQSKRYAFVKEGKFLVDDRDKILNTWIDENNGDIKGKTISVNEADFDSVPHYNLKLQLIKS